MKAIGWLIQSSVASLWAGFWFCIGWDAARTLIPWLLGALGR